MRVLSPDDVRKMVTRVAMSKPYGTYKLWAELHGMNAEHLSNFMRGWCGPPTVVMEALGLVWVIVHAKDLPADSNHAAGSETRRKTKPKGSFADENPMA